MGLLTVVQDVCAVVGVERPTSVFASISSNRTMLEMLAVANEMAQRTAWNTRDWTPLMVGGVLTGTLDPRIAAPVLWANGYHYVPGIVARDTLDNTYWKCAVDHFSSATGSFGLDRATFPGQWASVAPPPDETTHSLPSDFKRLGLTANMWRSTATAYPMRFVADLDEWLNRKLRGNYDSRGEWANFGGVIHIRPPLYGAAPSLPATPTTPAIPAIAAQTVNFVYLKTNCIRLALGGVGTTWQNDADEYMLDERTLKLGMVWHWKQLKGSPYAEDMGTWSDAVAKEMGTEAPAPILIDRLAIPDASMTSFGSAAGFSTALEGPVGPMGPEGPMGPPGEGAVPYDDAPLMDSGITGAGGLSDLYSRGDHRHPSDTSREPLITAGTTTQYRRGDKTWQTLDKAAVGLGNVDNTSDASKPVSTATQTALDLKAPLASPVFTGNPTAPTPTAGDNDTSIATTAFVAGEITTAAAAKVSKTGDTMTGALTATVFTSNKAASGQSSFLAGQKAGLTRWIAELGDVTAETGSGNTGSNFAVARFNDAGTYIDTPLGILRSTGVVSLTKANVGTTPVSTFDNILNIGFSGGGVQNGLSLRPVVDGTNAVVFCNAAATLVGTIATTGAATAYNTSSDERLKTDLQEFDAGRIVDQTDVYSFNWKKAPGERSYGVMAQQAVEVFPQAVTYNEKEDWWGIDYSKYVPVLLQEMKALRTRVAELEGASVVKPTRRE